MLPTVNHDYLDKTSVAYLQLLAFPSWARRRGSQDSKTAFTNCRLLILQLKANPTPPPLTNLGIFPRDLMVHIVWRALSRIYKLAARYRNIAPLRAPRLDHGIIA